MNNKKSCLGIIIKIIIILAVVFVVLFVALILFEIYLMRGLPIENYRAKKAVAAYLEETYPEPMKVIASSRFERNPSYHVKVKTLNEPVIEFTVTTNLERTKFHDTYFKYLAEYYLGCGLLDQLKAACGKDSLLSYVGVGYTQGVTWNNNEIENYDERLKKSVYPGSDNLQADGKFKPDIEELKRMFEGKFYITVRYEDKNATDNSYSDNISDEEILTCYNKILELGYKPADITMVYKYVKEIKYEDGHSITYGDLLSVYFGENMKIENIEGERAEDALIKNALLN